MSRDEAKGIKGKSPLLELDYFDFVLSVPAEYLHLICIGVTKRLVELTFDVGENRPRASTRKLSSAVAFNSLMLVIKTPMEFPRRARKLDFAVMKGQEYRNIVLFYFILVVDCIEPQSLERKLWLIFSFMIRACTIPQNEFQCIDHNIISTCSHAFYKLYEKLFTVQNCTYNTHIVGCHMIGIRRHGPLPSTSAFGFENFYGEMRNAFTPGTASPLKQIMQQIFLKRSINFHSCKPIITFTNYETARECNNLIYTFIHKTYRFFKIEDIENESMHCREIEKEEAFFNETPNLKWENVGVFVEGEIKPEIHIIQKKDIAGKLIRVQNYLLTCPMNVMEEK